MSTRTITDAQHALNIAKPEVKNILVIVARAHNGNEEVLFYWSLGGYASKPLDFIHAPFRNVITAVSEFTREIAEIDSAEVVLSTGTINISNANGQFDALIDYGWDRRLLDIYIGVANYPHLEDFRLLFSGMVNDAGLNSINRDEFELKLHDKMLALAVQFQSKRFDSGSSEGEIIPTCIGEVFNFSPVLIDKTIPRYRIDEFNFSTITVLRVNGNPSTNFTAYPDLGYIDLTTNPGTATITVDVIGRRVNLTTFQPDTTGAAITTASDILRHILLTKTTLTENDLDLTSFATFKTDRPQKCHVATKSDDAFAKWYTWLLDSVNGIGVLNKATGKLSVKKFEVPLITDTPAYRIREGKWTTKAISIKENIPPKKKITIGWRKNHTVQTSGLAGAVIENDPELVALYGREYSEVSKSNTIIEGEITSILWQSGNTIRYTFTGTPDMSGVIAGYLLTVINADTLNTGEFDIVGKGNYYVDVTNLSRSDATDDEVTTTGYGDVTIGKYRSAKVEPMIETLLTDETEAQEVADIKADLYSENVQRISIGETTGVIFSMDLGETVVLETEQLEPKLSETTGIIVQMSEDYQGSKGGFEILRRVA